MSSENVKESVIRQVEELCSNDGEKNNEALKAIPQLLSMVVADNKEIRQRFAESIEQSLSEYRPGFIIWLLELLGFNKKLLQNIQAHINRLDVASETTTENPEEVLKLVADLKEQLKMARDINCAQHAEKEISENQSSDYQNQVNMLARGYQKILSIVHAKEQNSEVENIMIDALMDIDAKVIWEKTEEDYGKMFRIINIPDDSRFFQNNMPCIKTNDRILCQGVQYKIVRGEDK